MDKLKNVFKVIFDIFKKIALFLLQMFKKAWSVKALRHVIIVIIIVLVIYIKTSVDKIGNESKAIKEYSNFIWPSNQLVNTIEKYNTDKGKVLYSTDKWFSMRLFIANKKEFLNYIEKIKQKGYDLEEDFTGNNTAKNRNDNLLKIEIEYLDKDNNTYIRRDMMEITIKKEESKEEKEKREKEARELEAKERKEQEQKKNESPKTTSNTIDPQFKKAMDSYESAMKEYSSFMKKYTSSSNPVSMMTDYNRIMEKYTNANNEFNKIKKESLNSAELAYYLEVQSRVVKNIN